MTASRANEWQARFDALAAAKTRAAIDAHLLPFRTVDAPKEPDRIGIGNAWSRRLFDGAFYISPPADNRRPACSLVFVQSADGNTGVDDPASLGGGATDTHLIYEGLSRVAADAVMAGAATVRGSGGGPATILICGNTDGAVGVLSIFSLMRITSRHTIPDISPQ